MATDVRLESREERHTRGGLEIVRTVLVTPYTDAPAIVATLLGEVKMSGGGYQRVLPHRDPLYPFCRCQEASVPAVDSLNVANIPTTADALNVAEYGSVARIVATYRPFENEDAGDEAEELEIATETFDFKPLIQQSPNHWWVVENGTDTDVLPREGMQFAKTYSVIDYTLTRNFCLTVPTLSMAKLANRVNKEAFSFNKRSKTSRVVQRRTWPAETMRYDGANVQRRITNKGIPFYTIAHKFGIMPQFDLIDTTVESAVDPINPNFVGWNRIFSHRLGVWKRPILKARQGLPNPRQANIYLDDYEIYETIKGQTVRGFDLLFNRYAS
jgi:hypothetical protein